MLPFFSPQLLCFSNLPHASHTSFMILRINDDDDNDDTFSQPSTLRYRAEIHLCDTPTASARFAHTLDIELGNFLVTPDV